MSDKSPESQAIIDEMKPLGEWLMEARPMTRALGRTDYVNRHRQEYMDAGSTYAEANEKAYDDLRVFDKEWDEKNNKYNKLATKYRKQRAKDDGVGLI